MRSPGSALYRVCQDCAELIWCCRKSGERDQKRQATDKSSEHRIWLDSSALIIRSLIKVGSWYELRPRRRSMSWETNISADEGH